MKQISIINDLNNDEPFALVVLESNTVSTYGISEKGQEWSEYVSKIDLKASDLDATLAPSLIAQSFVTLSRDVLNEIKEIISDEILTKSGLSVAETKSLTNPSQSKDQSPTRKRSSISDAPISAFVDKRHAINYKARAFAIDSMMAANQLQAKSARAIFDVNLPPSGGFRCPPGTRYGGRITDRFGRGCGPGLTRRIGNALERAGRGIGEVGEQRDKRRLARRAARADYRARRAQIRQDYPGVVGQAIDRFADRVEAGGQGRRGGRRATRRVLKPNIPDQLQRSKPGKKRTRRVIEKPTVEKRRDRNGRARRVGGMLDDLADRVEQGKKRPKRERRGEKPKKQPAVRKRIGERLDDLAQRVEEGRKRPKRERRGESPERQPIVKRRLGERLDDLAERVEQGKKRKEREREAQEQPQETEGRGRRPAPPKPESEKKPSTRPTPAPSVKPSGTRGRRVQASTKKNRLKPITPGRRVNGLNINYERLTPSQKDALRVESQKRLRELERTWRTRLAIGDDDILDQADIEAWIQQRVDKGRPAGFIGKLRADLNDFRALNEAEEKGDWSLVRNVGPTRRAAILNDAGLAGGRQAPQAQAPRVETPPGRPSPRPGNRVPPIRPTVTPPSSPGRAKRIVDAQNDIDKVKEKLRMLNQVKIDRMRNNLPADSRLENLIRAYEGRVAELEKLKTSNKPITPDQQRKLNTELEKLLAEEEQIADLVEEAKKPTAPKAPAKKAPAKKAPAKRGTPAKKAPAKAPAKRAPAKAVAKPKTTGINIDELAPIASNLAPHNPRRREHKLGKKILHGIFVPERVEKGNAGINTKQKAVEYVKNGGQLDDVPDEFLKEAILDNAAFPGEPLNGRRFKLEGDPGDGINNRNQPDPRHKTYLVTDTKTGLRYMLKTPSFKPNEYQAEQIGELVGQLAGRPMSRIRIASKVQRIRGRGRNAGDKPTAAVLIEHFADVIDVPDIDGGGSLSPTTPEENAEDIVNFIDAVLGNFDRHHNNYLWGGKRERLPIDHGILGDVGGSRNAVPVKSEAELDRIAQRFRDVVKRIGRLDRDQINEIIDAYEQHWVAANPNQLSDSTKENVERLRNTLLGLARRGGGGGTPPRSKKRELAPLQVKNKREPVINPFAPMPDEPGVLPIPEPIENPAINNVADAIRLFNNGADLNEIPHQYWHQVIAQNVNLPNGVRRWKKQAKMGGAIKQVEIFVRVDENGQSLNQGVVFNRQKRDIEDGMNEVMAQQVMVAMGMDVMPARLDGRADTDAPGDAMWAVMPFAWNNAPVGSQLPNGRVGVNFDADGMRALTDKAVKERLGHLMFNALLGIADRHWGNGMGGVFRDQDGNLVPYAVPIDMGWFARGDNNDFEFYARAFMMDPNVLKDIESVMRGGNLTPAQKDELRAELTEIYDNFIQRADRLLADKTEFVNNMLKVADLDNYARIYGWDMVTLMNLRDRVARSAEKLYRGIRDGRQGMENYRNQFLAKLQPAP